MPQDIVENIYIQVLFCYIYAAAQFTVGSIPVTRIASILQWKLDGAESALSNDDAVVYCGVFLCLV